MIDLFLAQSAPVRIFLLLAHGIVALFLAIGHMQWLGSRSKGRSDGAAMPPYFGAITTLFALILAFHASSIWSRQDAAQVQFRDTVTAIARLDSLLGQKGVGLEAARVHLSRYAEALAHEEWIIANRSQSLPADHELGELRQELVRASGRLPISFGNHLWRVFDDIVRARSERLWIGAHPHRQWSWALVLVLGFLSHIAIGFVHIDRPRAGRLALALFACATTATYGLLLRASDPFANLDPLQILQALSAS